MMFRVFGLTTFLRAFGPHPSATGGPSLFAAASARAAFAAAPALPAAILPASRRRAPSIPISRSRPTVGATGCRASAKHASLNHLTKRSQCSELPIGYWTSFQRFFALVLWRRLPAL